MRPGAWIKPHMGGPPRLVAHLGHLGHKKLLYIEDPTKVRLPVLSQHLDLDLAGLRQRFLAAT